MELEKDTELQSTETQDVVEDEVQTISQDDDGSESATEDDEKRPINQEAVNKAINKKHFQMQEERRKREAVEAELQKLKEEFNRIAKPQTKPEIPPMPDQFDPNYDLLIATRDRAIIESAKWDVVAAEKANKEREALETKQKKEAGIINAKISKYSANVVKYGLDPVEIQEDEKIVTSFGLSYDLRMHLLDDPNGPLLVKYLANNPTELDNIASMSPMQAAIRISNVLTPEAQKLRPKTSGTPDPSKPLDGRGVGDRIDPLIKGATFE